MKHKSLCATLPFFQFNFNLKVHLTLNLQIGSQLVKKIYAHCNWRKRGRSKKQLATLHFILVKYRQVSLYLHSLAFSI